ncbi:MAG: hypothetical protein J0M17_05180, partial [Planctomycetes bacterium]|nr:hypothetical protein [Planctomycetota bacterium]
ANAITWGYGPTGTFGFGYPHIVDRFHNTGHSELLTASFSEAFLVPYFCDGDIVPDEMGRQDSTLIRVLDFLKITKWIILLVVLIGVLAYGRWRSNEPTPMPPGMAPATLYPEWKSWDKLVNATKPGDTLERTTSIRLGKWKIYLAKGSQPWLNRDTGDPVQPDKGDVVLGWFEQPIALNDIETFSYAFECSNRDLEIKEVYAFLESNIDRNGIVPAYRQLKPTIDKNVKELEIREYRNGEKLLCFVLVASAGDDVVSIDPKTWGITLKRK